MLKYFVLVLVLQKTFDSVEFDSVEILCSFFLLFVLVLVLINSYFVDSNKKGILFIRVEMFVLVLFSFCNLFLFC